MTPPIEVAIVGCGAIAELAHVDAFEHATDRYRVAAVVDREPDRRDVLGERCGIPARRRHASVDAMLSAEPRHLLAVVALPARQLAAAALRLRDGGFRVLSEKPFAVSAAEARQWEGEDGIGIVHNYRYRTDVRQAAALVRAGAVGRVRFVRLERPDPGHFPGRGGEPDWRRSSPVDGGGCLLDNAYHWIYVAEELVGSPVQRVSAELALAGGTNDLAVVALRHADGALTTIQVAWCAPWAEPVLEVHGTAGSLRLTGDGGGCEVGGCPAPSIPPVVREPSYHAMYREVAEAVRLGGPVGESIASCTRVLEVLEAAYRSAEDGRSVRVGDPAPVEPSGGRRP